LPEGNPSGIFICAATIVSWIDEGLRAANRSGDYVRREQVLAAAREQSGSDTTPWCHSTPRRRFATPPYGAARNMQGAGIKVPGGHRDPPLQSGSEYAGRRHQGLRRARRPSPASWQATALPQKRKNIKTTGASRWSFSFCYYRQLLRVDLTLFGMVLRFFQHGDCRVVGHRVTLSVTCGDSSPKVRAKGERGFRSYTTNSNADSTICTASES
jgi:hypothetical protein